MTIKVDNIIKIQAAQLIEFSQSPEIFLPLLEQALQHNLETDKNHRLGWGSTIWRGQDMNAEVIRIVKRKHL